MGLTVECCSRRETEGSRAGGRRSCKQFSGWQICLDFLLKIVSSQRRVFFGLAVYVQDIQTVFGVSVNISYCECVMMYICTGGLKHSSVIDRYLVSAFVPFLPLEREHVKKCIKDNAMFKGMSLNEDQINSIADEMEYSPSDVKLFSSSGCKRVDEKVNMYRRFKGRHFEL